MAREAAVANAGWAHAARQRKLELTGQPGHAGHKALSLSLSPERGPTRQPHRARASLAS